MATLTLRPTGAGTYTELTPSTGANYTCVDETTADDADYVRNISSSAYKADTYALQDHTSETGTITSVTVYFRLQGSEAGLAGIPRLRLSSTNQDGSSQDCPVDFTTYSQVVARPGGGTWSWANIDSLEAGIYLSPNLYDTYYAICSWLYIVVTYTPVVNYPITSSVKVGTKPVGFTRLWNSPRTSTVKIGVKPIGSTRVWNSPRASSVLVGVKVSATRIWNVPIASTVLIGVKTTATRAWNRLITSAVLIGVKTTVTRALAMARTSAVLIGIKSTASRQWNVPITSSVLIGVKVSALRVWNSLITSAVKVGVKVTATRTLAIARTSIVRIGTKVSATRLLAISRTSVVLIGVKVSAVVTSAITAITGRIIYVANKVFQHGHRIKINRSNL